MSLFISYSHADAAFVDRLADSLVEHDNLVWVDKWELNVGDSIVDKIQEAILASSALLVILSKSSVRSHWCLKELSAGLIRELDEKRVLVLPVLLEDCTIPIFLRDKKYADFRAEFRAGLDALLGATRRISQARQGSITTDVGRMDWDIDFGMRENDPLRCSIAVIESPAHVDFKVLIQIDAEYDEVLTSRYVRARDRRLAWLAGQTCIRALLEYLESDRPRLVVDGDRRSATFADTISYEAPRSSVSLQVAVRRVGAIDGYAAVADVGGCLRRVYEQVVLSTRSPDERERQELREIYAEDG